VWGVRESWVCEGGVVLAVVFVFGGWWGGWGGGGVLGGGVGRFYFW